MKSSERSFLLKPTPGYVEFNGLRRTQRFRDGKFRCCLYAAFMGFLIMVLVAITSLLANHAETMAATNETEGINLLLAYDPESVVYFPPEELKSAIDSGNEAIKERYLEDLNTKELESPSPSSRHQYAVNTGLKVKNLSYGAIGEIAATKRIEEMRLQLGMPSAVGRHFDVGWVPEGGCKEFTIINCRPSKYRTFDGTCNHRHNYGAAYTPFRRILPPDYSNKIDSPRSSRSGKQLPSARDVSLRVHKPSYSSNPSFTVMVAVFGQFIDHDITATALSQGAHGKALSCCTTSKPHPECFPVQLSKDDPNYKLTGSTCMEFVRSAPAPQCKIGPREQLNQVTAFIDGSAIYGSGEEIALRLRKGVDGLLYMIETTFNTTLLPPSKDVNDGCNRELEIERGRYCFDSGDKRANENLHLTTMHVIWARQHNRLASQLKDMNPSWKDEQLFQEARRIVGAQLQHVTYNELLPIILGENVTMSQDLKSLGSGFRKQVDKNLNPSVANSFATAAFRFAHTLLPGLMKVANGEEESSEDFVTLHRIFFNPYQLYSSNNFDKTIKSVLSTFIQKTSTHVTSELSQHLFEDTGKNNSRLSCGLDLVSLNIQRGRDHGLPSYPNWREFCLGKRPRSFDDLEGELDEEALEEISKIYENIEDVDLYTGALAEKPVGNGLVGPTFSCLLADQFKRLQQGDRFWYEVEGEDGSFTEEQLNEIRKTSLAKVICDCSDNIVEIQREVMKSVNEGNSMQSCDSLPEMNLTFWREM